MKSHILILMIYSKLCGRFVILIQRRVQSYAPEETNQGGSIFPHPEIRRREILNSLCLPSVCLGEAEIFSSFALMKTFLIPQNWILPLLKKKNGHVSVLIRANITFLLLCEEIMKIYQIKVCIIIWYWYISNNFDRKFYIFIMKWQHEIWDI